MALGQVEMRLYPCAAVLWSRKRQSLDRRKRPEGNGFLTEMQGFTEAEVQVYLPPLGTNDSIHQRVQKVELGRSSFTQWAVSVLLIIDIVLCDIGHAQRTALFMVKRTSTKEVMENRALEGRANEHDVCPERQMQRNIGRKPARC